MPILCCSRALPTFSRDTLTFRYNASKYESSNRSPSMFGIASGIGHDVASNLKSAEQTVSKTD
jgi:hypothetical protein